LTAARRPVKTDARGSSGGSDHPDFLHAFHRVRSGPHCLAGAALAICHRRPVLPGPRRRRFRRYAALIRRGPPQHVCVQFRQLSFYLNATAEFVDPENEAILLVEGDRLAEPGAFQMLEDFQFELQLTEGIDSVYSLFALREKRRTKTATRRWSSATPAPD
jgi:hypothetical protein